MDQKTCTTGGDKRATRNTKNTRRDLQHYYNVHSEGKSQRKPIYFFYFLFVSFSRNNLPLLEGGEVKEKKKKKARRQGGHIERLLFIFPQPLILGLFFIIFFSPSFPFLEGGGDTMRRMQRQNTHTIYFIFS